MQKCFEVIDLSHMRKIVKIILENVSDMLLSTESYRFMHMDAELYKSI